MSGFTPGPWRYGDEDNLFGVDFVQVYAGAYGDQSFRSVANVEAAFDGENHLSLDEETRANARLIAAAPTLLEALEGLVLVLDAIYETEGLNPMEMEALNEARAAIAAARGDA